MLKGLENEASAILKSTAGDLIVREALQGRRAISDRLRPAEIDLPAQSTEAPPWNLVARNPVEKGRVALASIHPFGPFRSKEGRLVPGPDAIDVVEARVEILDRENVIVIGELAMGDTQPCLPGIRSAGACIRDLGVGVPGFRFEYAIVEYDSAGFGGWRERRFDPTACVSVEAEEVSLEFFSVDQVTAAPVDVTRGLERRVQQNSLVDLIVDLPIALDAIAHRDRANLLDAPNTHDDGECRAVGGSQVLISLEVDIVCGRSNVDTV